VTVQTINAAYSGGGRFRFNYGIPYYLVLSTIKSHSHVSDVPCPVKGKRVTGFIVCSDAFRQFSFAVGKVSV
jgi:hypothetical protein